MTAPQHVPRLIVVAGVFPPFAGGTGEIIHNLAARWPADRIAVLTPKSDGWQAVDAGLAGRVVRSDLFTVTTARYDWLAPEELARIRSASPWNRLFARSRLVRLVVKLLLVPRIVVFGLRRRWDAYVSGYLFGVMGLAGWILKALTGRPLVGIAVGEDMTAFDHRPSWTRRLHRHWLRRYDLVLAISEPTRRTAMAWGVPPERVVVWHPGVDCGRFSPRVDGSAVRARHGLGGAKVILSVGRLVDRKGVDTILRALPGVLRRHADVKYVVVGSGSYERPLRRLSEELEVSPNVVFAGSVPAAELPQYYAACDLLALVSRPIRATGDDEGFGMSLIEAGAAGKPVIGSRTGGIVDAVADGVTGILVDPLSPEEVAEAIVKLLDTPGLREAMGQAARRRAEADFSWDTLIPRLGAELAARFRAGMQP